METICGQVNSLVYYKPHLNSAWLSLCGVPIEYKEKLGSKQAHCVLMILLHKLLAWCLPAAWRLTWWCGSV